MRTSFLVILCAIFLLLVVLPAGASVQYDVAEAMIGDAETFPLERRFVEEKMGKPDFTESVAGFPAPLEYYLIEGSDEISHVYFAYGTGEGAEKTYAIGVVMKGVDLAAMVGMMDEMAKEGGESMVILRGEQFAILDVLGPGVPQLLWAIFEERTLQGEKRLFSTLIPPENLIPYFAVVYPNFQEPLQKAIEERVKKE